MQIGVTDVVSRLIQNPTTFALIILFVSGYVFLVVSGRKTELWKEASPSERLLIGIAISAGLEPIFFILTLEVYYFFGNSIDFGTLLLLSSSLVGVVYGTYNQAPRSDVTCPLLSPGTSA